MDDKKIIKLNIDSKKKKNDSDKKDKRFFSLQTNPIIQKMLFESINNKKGKFSLKDLFR